MLFGAAASSIGGTEEVPVFQFDEHGVSMVSANAAAAAARVAAGAPVDAAARSKLEAKLLENASIACAGHGVDCRKTSCCSQPGLQCFEKDNWWASCKEHCIPGSLDPEDPPGKKTPWTCKAIGPRSPPLVFPSLANPAIVSPPLAAGSNGAKNQLALRKTGMATSATPSSSLLKTAKESRSIGKVIATTPSSDLLNTMKESTPSLSRLKAARTTPSFSAANVLHDTFAYATNSSSPWRKAPNHSDEVEIVLKVNDSDAWHVPTRTRHMVVLASGRHVMAEVVHSGARPGRTKALRQPQPDQPQASANTLGMIATAAIVAIALLTLAIQVGIVSKSNDSKQYTMHMPISPRQQTTARGLERVPTRTSSLSEFDVPPHHETKRRKDLTGLVLW